MWVSSCFVALIFALHLGTISMPCVSLTIKYRTKYGTIPVILANSNFCIYAPIMTQPHTWCLYSYSPSYCTWVRNIASWSVMWISFFQISQAGQVYYTSLLWLQLAICTYIQLTMLNNYFYVKYSSTLRSVSIYIALENIRVHDEVFTQCT